MITDLTRKVDIIGGMMAKHQETLDKLIQILTETTTEEEEPRRPNISPKRVEE